jgi:hypothetical protein
VNSVVADADMYTLERSRTLERQRSIAMLVKGPLW